MVDFPNGVPRPPYPGGEHSHHFVQDTSLSAYRRYLLNAKAREQAILCHLDRQGWHGAINDEGWRALGYDTPNQYAPTITALKTTGVVVWRGDHRRTRADCSAKVWVTAAVWVQHHLGPLAEQQIGLF